MNNIPETIIDARKFYIGFYTMKNQLSILCTYDENYTSYIEDKIKSQYSDHIIHDFEIVKYKLKCVIQITYKSTKKFNVLQALKLKKKKSKKLHTELQIATCAIEKLHNLKDGTITVPFESHSEAFHETIDIKRFLNLKTDINLFILNGQEIIDIQKNNQQK